VTEPFGIRNNMAVSRRSQSYGRESGVESGEEHEDLKWILYLSVAFAAIEIIVIYGKYDFLNVINSLTLVDSARFFTLYLCA
jgi:hypothetical protein